MKTLIFGGAGFIGANLASYLMDNEPGEILVFDNFSMGNQIVRAGLECHVIEGDMTDFESVEAALRTFGPDRVFHLAANSDIAASARNPAFDLNNTMLTTAILAQVLRANPVKELVFASSSAIFGDVNGVIGEDTVPNPLSSYGWMKLASEYILGNLADDGVVEKYLCVRFPNVTGSWQTHGVVRDLIRKLRNNPEVLQVLGDGTQTKPYALASDLVTSILRICNASWSGRLEVNLGPPDQVSVSEIVALILDVTKLQPAIQFGSSRSGWVGDVPEYKFDLGKLGEVLGENPFRSSRSAARASIEWEWSQGQVAN